MDQLSLTAVLPLGPRGAPLAAAVAECLALRAQPGIDVEIIIADASGDPGTAAAADRLAATHGAVAVIRYPHPRGYRAALHDAWGAARGAYIAALDPAGPASAAGIARLVQAATGCAAVFGYRMPPARRPGDLAFAAVVRARLAPGLRDPSLRLGLFRADLRELLAPEGPDALAHAEIYAAARRRKLALTEVAVHQRPGPGPAPGLADILAALKAHGPAERAAGVKGAAGAGMLLAACGLWLLRRRRRP